MITFSDGYRISHDDVRKATIAAVSSMLAALPKEGRRMDVVKAVTAEGSKMFDTLPIQFSNDKE